MALVFKTCPVGTVDGPEIRRSPVEVGSLSHYLQGFAIHPRWFFALPGSRTKLPKLSTYYSFTCLLESWKTCLYLHLPVNLFKHPIDHQRQKVHCFHTRLKSQPPWIIFSYQKKTEILWGLGHDNPRCSKKILDAKKKGVRLKIWGHHFWYSCLFIFRAIQPNQLLGINHVF